MLSLFRLPIFQDLVKEGSIKLLKYPNSRSLSLTHQVTLRPPGRGGAVLSRQGLGAPCRAVGETSVFVVIVNSVAASCSSLAPVSPARRHSDWGRRAAAATVPKVVGRALPPLSRHRFGKAGTVGKQARAFFISLSPSERGELIMVSYFFVLFRHSDLSLSLSLSVCVCVCTKKSKPRHWRSKAPLTPVPFYKSTES